MIRCRFGSGMSVGWLFTLCVPCLLCVLTVGDAQESDDHFEQRVQTSIDKGVSYLYGMMEEQKIPQTRITEVYPLGIRALPAYALLEAGTSANAPRIRRLFKEMERIPLNRVYSVAIYAFALDALNRRTLENEDNQRRRVKIVKAYKRRLTKIVDWIEKTRSRPRGIWGYDDVSGSNPWDVWLDFSNTQFAVLALQVGLANDVEVSDEVFEEIIMSHSKNAVVRTDGVAKLFCEGGGWWTDSREPPEAAGRTRVGGVGSVTLGAGGFSLESSALEWPYRPHWGKESMQGQPGRFTRYAMQAAATSSLMVAREALASRGKLSGSDLRRVDALIAGGVISLHKGFNTLAPAVVGSLFTNYYYDLYSFEKAMDLGGIVSFGGIDWYREQALTLMAAQREDGGWGSGRRQDVVYDVVSTSFALLFLNRATQNLRISPAKPILTGGGQDSGGIADGKVFVPSKNGMVALDELFTRLATSRTIEYLDLAKEVVKSVAPDEIPELLPYLVSACNESGDTVDRYTREQVESISGLTTVDADRVQSWVQQWRQIRKWGRNRDAQRVAAIGQVLDAAATTDPMRVTCVSVLVRIGSLDGVSYLLKALEARSPVVRERAAGALERLTLHTEPFDPNAADPARAAGLWRDYWAREEEGLRFRLVWDQLRDQLESARDEEARLRAREKIVALGKVALPAIEEILSRGRYAFDWVLIQERITGTRKGL